MLHQTSLTGESKVKRDKLAGAIEAYHRYRAGDNLAKSTLKTEDWVLRKFLTLTGNIYAENLTEDHVEAFMTLLWQTNKARAMVNHFHMMKRFFTWLHDTERIRRNPMARRRAPKFQVEERRRISSDRFGDLLDAAENPIRRMALASGLYLLSRDSELSRIRIGDLMWDIKRVRTPIVKRTGRSAKTSDDMPMTIEYQRELARFLPWYEDQMGPLQPNWFLHPGLTQPKWESTQGRAGWVHRQYLMPLKASRRHNEWAQDAMEQIGFATRREDGSSYNEGMHTLRRSGARARFNELRHLGYDGALREVQMLLHHAHGSMTEHYIGIDLDTLKRDEALIDQPMYPSLMEGPEEVVDLSVFLPGTATAPNPDDVIDLASRRRGKGVVPDGGDIVYPTLKQRGYIGGSEPGHKGGGRFDPKLIEGGAR